MGFRMKKQNTRKISSFYYWNALTYQAFKQHHSVSTECIRFGTWKTAQENDWLKVEFQRFEVVSRHDVSLIHHIKAQISSARLSFNLISKICYEDRQVSFII